MVVGGIAVLLVAGGGMGVDEQKAAAKAAVHGDTCAVTHLDSLARPFLAVAHNRFSRSDAAGGPTVEAFHHTRSVFDIEGNPRDAIDALNRVVMRYDYDMLGARVRSSSMDAGERWVLNDVAGKPLYTWNGRGHRMRAVYDTLRRPAELHLQEGDQPELLVARTAYGESQADATARNLLGRSYQTFDGAGVSTSDAYDFKGNATSSTRQFAVDYRNTLDWSAAVALEAEAFTSSTRFDALNRPITQTLPDGSLIRPAYNEANLLDAVDANLRGESSSGQPVWTPIVADIAYNAKGQRERIAYGSGAATTYAYDPLTFRLTHLQTRRDNERLQDLSYVYDPVGNVTHIRDDAQQTIYFRNVEVEPSGDYTYDAIYQLIAATGREHRGQAGDRLRPPTAPDALTEFHAGHDHPGDSNAMGRYAERYAYDLVGNILEMQHRGSDPSSPGWTRAFAYDEPSLIPQIGPDAPSTNNRLTSTTAGRQSLEPCSHDPHGNITSMAHLSLMRWNHADQLVASASQVVNSGSPETTYYVYDHAGQRVRKVVDRATSNDQARRIEERLYLGGVERYRVYEPDGTSVNLERETLHIKDGQQRVALVDTRTRGDDGSPSQLIRFQLGNHLGSACLELDGRGVVVSYEEYSPFGSTTYQAVDAATNAAAKRYRYAGKERDEETGFYYHGARYYACWLGRWTSSDPSIHQSLGTSPYRSMGNNPVVLTDPDGRHESRAAVLQELRTLGPEGYQTAHREQIAAGTVAGQALNWFLSQPLVAGSLQVIGGALEMTGGVGLLAAPEPSISKLGGAALVAHGADTASTGVATLVSGEIQQTLTASTAERAVVESGYSPDTARRIGAGVDVAVPLGASLLVSASAGLRTLQPAPSLSPRNVTSIRPLGDEFIDAAVARASARPATSGSYTRPWQDEVIAYADADSLTFATRLSTARGFPHVVTLGEIHTYPEAAKVTLVGHANLASFGGMTPERLVGRLSGVNPDVIELVGCNSAYQFSRDVAYFAGADVIGYKGVVRVVPTGSVRQSLLVMTEEGGIAAEQVVDAGSVRYPAPVRPTRR